MTRNFGIDYECRMVRQLDIDVDGGYGLTDLEQSVMGDVKFGCGDQSYTLTNISIIYVAMSIVAAIKRLLFVSDVKNYSQIVSIEGEEEIEMFAEGERLTIAVVQDEVELFSMSTDVTKSCEIVGNFFMSISRLLIHDNPDLLMSGQFQSTFPEGQYFHMEKTFGDLYKGRKLR